MRVEATSEKNREILLDVPKYDFNWQHTYVLRNPIPLKSLNELTFTATFDNSTENRCNPDPTAFVTWGDQTWEEMAIVFYEVAIPIAPESKSDDVNSVSQSSKSTSTDKTQKLRELVAKLFPLQLKVSQSLRLSRLYKGSVYKPDTGHVQVPLNGPIEAVADLMLTLLSTIVPPDAG